VLNVPRAKLEDKHVASVQKRVTTVRDELGRDVSTREVRDAIMGGIESCYGVQVESGVLMKEELALAEELYQTKYSRLEWNLEP
jgi:lipoate-protein ligase A